VLSSGRALCAAGRLLGCISRPGAIFAPADLAWCLVFAALEEAFSAGCEAVQASPL